MSGQDENISAEELLKKALECANTSKEILDDVNPWHESAGLIINRGATYQQNADSYIELAEKKSTDLGTSGQHEVPTSEELLKKALECADTSKEILDDVNPWHEFAGPVIDRGAVYGKLSRTFIELEKLFYPSI